MARKKMETAALLRSLPLPGAGATAGEMVAAFAGGGAPAPKPAAAEKTVGVFYQVLERQRRVLVQVATRRMNQKGGGKLDSSEVLREVIDAGLKALEL